MILIQHGALDVNPTVAGAVTGAMAALTAVLWVTARKWSARVEEDPYGRAYDVATMSGVCAVFGSFATLIALGITLTARLT